jgi:hypothetical protein
VWLPALWEAMIPERRVDAGRRKERWTRQWRMGGLFRWLGRRVGCPAGMAAREWPRVSLRGCHELSMRRGAGPWQGQRVWMEIRVPTPQRGQSLGLPAMSTAW